MKGMNTSDVDALLKGALRLDRVVLNQVFDIFYPKIFSYVIFRIGDPQLGGRITGQVFTDLLESLSKQGEPDQNLAGWLYQTAANLVQTNLNNIVFESAIGDLEAEPVLEIGKAQKPVPGLMEYRLQAVFQGLIPEHQHLLALRFGSKCAIEEMSRSLGKPPRFVKELQFQALKALQQALKARIR